MTKPPSLLQAFFEYDDFLNQLIANDSEELVGELADQLFKEFTALQLPIQKAVDRRLYLKKDLEQRIQTYREERDFANRKKKMTEKMLDRFRENTKEVLKQIQEVSGEKKVHGTKGHIRLQNSSSDKLDLDFEPEDRMTYYNIISEDVVEKYDIPPEFIKTFHIHCLDKKWLKKRIKQGVELTWARMQPGESVGFQQ